MDSISETKSVDLDDKTKKELLSQSTTWEWEEVVKKYKENPRVRKAQITESGNTVLHIAVSQCFFVVEELVQIITEKGEAKEVLEIKNKRGNTPLHLAAATTGSDWMSKWMSEWVCEWMCEWIAIVDASLVGARNEDNETPLFLAALHGNTKAFFHLHNICAKESPDKRYDYCKRNDGDTILHCAIDGYHFDLAFQIIHLYPDLVNSVNKRGFSPLHRLASKPFAFKSGNDLGIWSKIIYYCMDVPVLKPSSDQQSMTGNDNLPSSDQQSTIETTRNDEKNTKYPGKCQKCVDFFRLFWDLVQGGVLRLGLSVLPFTSRKEEKKEGKEADAENPEGVLRLGSSSLPVTTKKEEKNDGNEADVENPQGVLRLGPSSLPVTTKKGEKKDGKEADAENPQGFLCRCRSWIVDRLDDLLFFILELFEMVILGLGYGWIKKIRYHKKMHVWSVQITKELLLRYKCENTGTNSRPATSPTEDETQRINALDKKHSEDHEKKTLNTQSSETNQEDKDGNKNVKDKDVEGKKDKSRNTKEETPILIAAKNGVTEMVEKILESFPEAIHEMNTDEKNIVLLAVENRQPQVYELLLKSRFLENEIFQKVDINGNNAIHLALKLGDKSWRIPGPALQMHWEMKWVEFVLGSVPLQFIRRDNKEGKDPWVIFAETHKDLLEKGSKWLNDMSQSCSLVAGLLVTVAYATSTTVPGGVKENQGTPVLEHYLAFQAFAAWSLIAFYSSLSAVVMFLSILTSGYQVEDFRKAVFIKLLLGLTALYVSIASTLASFTAAHYFILKDKLKKSAAPVYTGTCLLVTLFAIAQFPIYFKLVWATFKKVPDRSYRSELQYAAPPKHIFRSLSLRTQRRMEMAHRQLY